MSYFQHYGSEIVQVWNNVVGFQQLQETDLDDVSLEDWLHNLPDVRLTQTTDYEPSHDFFLFQVEWPEFALIGVARDTIYTPAGEEPITNLDHYNILNGFRVIYDTWTIEQFCQSLQDPNARIAQHLVQFNNHTTYFVCERIGSNPVETYISIPGNEKCFRMGLNWTTRVSHLYSLFYDVKHTHCYGLPKQRVGTWFLEFVDACNIHTHMRKCSLTDESELNGYPAACVYSLHHNGLTWYMAHKFLIEAKSIEACIAVTNAYIQKASHYWQTKRHETGDLLKLYCEDFPLPLPHMVKFYTVNIQLHATTNPAWFEWIGEEFKVFRSTDVMHVFECETDFVVSEGLSAACRFRCETSGPEWLYEVPDEHILEQYYRALFPLLQSCHDRIRLQKRNREPELTIGECHALDCITKPKSGIDCLEFCEAHFEDSIQAILDVSRIVSVANGHSELVAKIREYYIYSDIGKRPTSPETVVSDLRSFKDAETVTLAARYQFAMFLEDVESVTGYHRNQQVDLGTRFDFNEENARLELYFEIMTIKREQ